MVDDVGVMNFDDWKRSQFDVDVDKDDVVIQSLDVDYVLAPPMRGFYEHDIKTMVAVIRMFGTTSTSQSVQVNVHGFLPYFYIEVGSVQFGYGDLTKITAELNAILQEKAKNAVLLVEHLTKETIMFWNKNPSIGFLKITLSMPTVVTFLRGELEKGVRLTRLGHQSFQTYESNFLFVLRFMVDCNIFGASWITIPKKSYWKRSTNCYAFSTKKTSTAQVEIDVHYKRLIPHFPEGEWQSIAPLRTLSFDIECKGRVGVFPEPNVDPVIQIGNTLAVFGSPMLRKCVFTLDTCDPIPGAVVLSFANEREMLMAWKEFVLAVDPDILTGYNIVGFDLPYLIGRAEALDLKEFPYLGRIAKKQTKVVAAMFSSNQTGSRETKEINIEGRVQFDVMILVMKALKLRSYGLNPVCAEFLGEQKDDVPHTMISILQDGDASTRRKLAVYCLKDTVLPLMLTDKLMFIYNYVEMARVTGVPMTFLISRGQQVKVLTQVYRKANQQNMLVPCTSMAKLDEKYEGATVIEPKRGFYSKPVATLDFASLYPSIMMAHNLCYSTLIPKDQLKNIPPGLEVTLTPCGDTFVKPSVKKGVLPQILEELLGARKRAKLDLKKETDSQKKAVLDGRQLALKISANSVYGFTGATVGKLACLEIASSVTAFGRQMIDMTKNRVMERYSKANGYPFDADVIYGDTDSVMVLFGMDDLAESMRLGKEAADYVSSFFIKPIKLEFEKCYFPYLLMNKKRYAGMFWTNTIKYDKMDAKGIETVRRDFCPLTSTTVQTCLNLILIDGSVEKAKEHAKKVIADLLMGKVGMEMLVITKSFSKAGDQYKAKQAHVELADRMRKRDAGSAPKIGDRVPYVVVAKSKDSKGFEKSEDPLYALANDVPIDVQHYLDHQLKLPLLRLFEAVMDDPNDLFKGDHMRSVHHVCPTKGGMAKFIKKVRTCVRCNCSMKANGPLCEGCKPFEPSVLLEKLDELRRVEVDHSRLWTQCQRCHGNMSVEVVCAARECPIFYKRVKAKKDLERVSNVVARFDVDDW